MTAIDLLSLWLALGGVAGSVARVLITQSQSWRDRKSIGDVVVGFAVGYLWPLYPLIDFPATATTPQKAVIVAVIAYFAGDVIQNGLSKLASMARVPGNGAPAPKP